jgi:hypothetical protein
VGRGRDVTTLIEREGADLVDNSPDDPVALKRYPMDLVLPVMGPDGVQGDREKGQSTFEWKAGRRIAEVEEEVENTGRSQEVQRNVHSQYSFPDRSFGWTVVDKVGEIFMAMAVDARGILRMHFGQDVL